MARPFAVFDIDGTLIRWQLYHALADELARQGHLNPKEFARVREARMAWKKRSGEFSFNDYEQALVQLVAKAITGIEPEVLQAAADEVIAEYRDQVYTYTRDLIRELKSSGYLLFTISGSQAEVVGRLADYYGFDDWGGSSYEIQNGHYTGKMDIMRSERKPEYLKHLVEKHHAGWQGSIGVGDSEGDIPMLSLIERPIAFNPNRQLYEHARSQGWPVVVERKNVVYQLDNKDGEYKLKA